MKHWGFSCIFLNRLSRHFKRQCSTSLSMYHIVSKKTLIGILISLSLADVNYVNTALICENFSIISIWTLFVKFDFFVILILNLMLFSQVAKSSAVNIFFVSIYSIQVKHSPANELPGEVHWSSPGSEVEGVAAQPHYRHWLHLFFSELAQIIDYYINQSCKVI